MGNSKDLILLFAIFANYLLLHIYFHVCFIILDYELILSVGNLSLHSQLAFATARAPGHWPVAIF